MSRVSSSRQLDVLSPGAEGTEQVSRAIQIRDELAIQKEQMQLERERARAAQEQAKAELQQRELERVTSVEEAQRQREFVAQEGQENRAHDQELAAARGRIEKEILTQTETFAREREERMNQRDNDRFERGLQVYERVQREQEEARARHNQNLANLLAAKQAIDVLEGRADLDVESLQQHIQQLNAASEQSRTLLRDAATSAAANLKTFVEQARTRDLGTEQYVEIGGQQIRIDNPGSFVIRGLGEAVSPEQRQALDAVYTTLVASGSGQAPDTDVSRAAINGAIEAAKATGLTVEQMDVVFGEVARALTEVANSEQDGRIRSALSRSVDALGRRDRYGIDHDPTQFRVAADAAARVRLFLQTNDLTPEATATMFGQASSDPRLLEIVTRLDEIYDQVRPQTDALRQLQLERVSLQGDAAAGPSPEALAPLIPR